MRVAALVTGGKDSALALYRALKSGYDVKFLVTMIPQREDSWMFHYPNIQLTELFANAVNIPLVKAETLGVKEKELEDLESLLRTLDVVGIVSGGISSQYQKTRIEKGLDEFPCKQVRYGFLQSFAEAFNPEIEVICRVCPPDKHGKNVWCEWEFKLLRDKV